MARQAVAGYLEFPFADLAADLAEGKRACPAGSARQGLEEAGKVETWSGRLDRA
jgi:hypothetical protein